MKFDNEFSIKNRIESLLDTTHFQENPPFPKNIMLEITNICNHKCVFCANPKMTRQRGFMKISLAEKLLKDAYELGAREAGFYTTGDPFVYKELPILIKFAKETGYDYTYISTNGGLASKSRLDAVISAGLDSLKFSINAGDRQTYKLIHGKDDWQKVIENLKYASSLRKKSGKSFKLAITYVVTSMNYDQIYSFKNEFDDLVDDIHFSQCGNQVGNMINNISTLAVYPQGVTSAQRAAPCPIIFNRLHVSCEGYMTLCCVDYQNYLAICDVNEMSLMDAWHSSGFMEMRRRHLKNRLQGTLCYNCLYNKNNAINPLEYKLSTRVDFPEFAALESRKK